jgi:prolyl oligopeptidase PreP (S9A serine peptidase family)
MSSTGSLVSTSKGQSSVGLQSGVSVIPGIAITAVDSLSSDKLVVCYIHDVKSVLELRSLRDGSFIQNFPIEVGTVTGYSGKKEHSELFFQFASFLTPGRIYHVDFSKQSFEAKVKSPLWRLLSILS